MSRPFIVLWYSDLVFYIMHKCHDFYFEEKEFWRVIYVIYFVSDLICIIFPHSLAEIIILLQIHNLVRGTVHFLLFVAHGPQKDNQPLCIQNI